jgi:2-desacetyl-2-hydroxyethyl bacteriochlorophyllide A dehydrogenase
MRAAVWNGPEDLSLQDVPVPELKMGEVMIKTKVVGICGSDLEVYSGRYKQSKPPMILGHEGGGIVHALGEGVSSLRVGDRVIAVCMIYCGRCAYCRRGYYGICENIKVLGMMGAQGEYADFFVVPERNCYKIPDSISWPEAGLIDTLAGPAYVMEKLNVPLDATVAVFGPGPAGLFFCRLSKLRGAAKVFLVGTRDYRLKHGPAYGADRVINVNEENPEQVICEETGGKGADIVIEAAGSQRALNDCLMVTRKAGVLLLYGVFGAGPVSVDIQPVQLNELTMLGTATVHYPLSIRLIESGQVAVKDLISHTLTLEELVDAFSSGLIEERRENYMKGVVLFQQDTV